MNILKAILFLVAAITSSAQAASDSTECSDSYGTISVLDGNVTIKDGIGDVGPVNSRKEIAQVSETTKNCVEGPNYEYTRITVEEIVYDIEENVKGTAVVLCTQVKTGISNKKCK